MKHKRLHSTARKTSGEVLVITLNPELSRQWQAASEQTGIPLDWMIHDTLKGDAEHYLAPGTGYAKDTRPVWYAQRAVKIPIQVAKA